MTDDFFLQPSDVPQRQELPGITPEQRAFIEQFFGQPHQIDKEPVTDESWPMPKDREDLMRLLQPGQWTEIRMDGRDWNRMVEQPKAFDLDRLCEEARDRLAVALNAAVLGESFEVFAEGRNAYWLMVARHEGL